MRVCLGGSGRLLHCLSAVVHVEVEKVEREEEYFGMGGGEGGLSEVVEEDCLGNGVGRGEVVWGLGVMGVSCGVCKEGGEAVVGE